MLRGLLVSLLFIGLAVYSLSSGTLALFTDSETSSGFFKAGTLDFRYRVSQDGGLHWGEWQNGSSATFNLPRLRRGQNGRVIYQIENLGTVSSLLNIRNVIVVDYENGCTNSEQRVDSTCGNPGVGQGELGATLLVTAMAGAINIYSGQLNGFSGDYNINLPIAGGGMLEMTIDWLLPSLPGGTQGDGEEDNDNHGNGIINDPNNSQGNGNDDGNGTGNCNGNGNFNHGCGSGRGDIIDGDSTSVSFRFDLTQA
ncbi:MAG: hypothetical protein HW384_743 [Dehalococcoidia bacterium]|nr:hypothetical protein [Dehalococcoidia bacterium]